MPDVYQGGKLFSSKGSEAGEDQKYDEISEQSDWDAYKKENKLSFAASKTQHKAAFDAWRQKRKKGSTAKTGTPIVKTGM